MSLTVDIHGPEEVLRDATVSVGGAGPIGLSEWISSVEWRLTELGANLQTAQRAMKTGPFTDNEGNLV